MGGEKEEEGCGRKEDQLNVANTKGKSNTPGVGSKTGEGKKGGGTTILGPGG